MWATSVIFKQLPKGNNQPFGRISPHRLTLVTYIVQKIVPQFFFEVLPSLARTLARVN
jgi:hypothetical protein